MEPLYKVSVVGTTACMLLNTISTDYPLQIVALWSSGMGPAQWDTGMYMYVYVHVHVVACSHVVTQLLNITFTNYSFTAIYHYCYYQCLQQYLPLLYWLCHRRLNHYQSLTEQSWCLIPYPMEPLYEVWYLCMLRYVVVCG